MTDQYDEVEFSWLELFFVTGACFLGFCLFLELTKAHYPAIFLWIGIINLILGSITGLYSLLNKNNKRTDLYAPEYDDIFDKTE